MSNDLEAIGQIIAYGLDPRLSPGRNARYAELVALFRNDSKFRSQVDIVTVGQGLQILDCSPIYGLVLTASGPDSPYHMRLDEYAPM
ncbi:MAG TPA: hypothetical protein VMP89_17600, partial [Solirubrobacteraceae bacterium]|nr:hypothetical protein [Solirubrobacteraceae bacterium]